MPIRVHLSYPIIFQRERGDHDGPPSSARRQALVSQVGTANGDLGGSAVRDIREAASALGVTPQKFVARAVKQAIKIVSARAMGYRPILRDDRGVEIDIDY